MWPIIAITFFATVIFVLSFVHERKEMGKYLLRSCIGVSFRWRRQFPNASKNEIREFLDQFTEAFGFKTSWRLHFLPDDRVMDIYRVRYPIRGTPDGCELEYLIKLLRKRYGIDVFKSWREDVTLGDLFTRIREHNS